MSDTEPCDITSTNNPNLSNHPPGDLCTSASGIVSKADTIEGSNGKTRSQESLGAAGTDDGNEFEAALASMTKELHGYCRRSGKSSKRSSKRGETRGLMHYDKSEDLWRFEPTDKKGNATTLLSHGLHSALYKYYTQMSKRRNDGSQHASGEDRDDPVIPPRPQQPATHTFAIDSHQSGCSLTNRGCLFTFALKHEDQKSSDIMCPDWVQFKVCATECRDKTDPEWYDLGYAIAYQAGSYDSDRNTNAEKLRSDTRGHISVDEGTAKRMIESALYHHHFYRIEYIPW